MRGFLSGWIWGLVAIALGAAALSLLSPLGGRAPELVSAPPGGGADAPARAGAGGPPAAGRAPSPARTAPAAPRADTTQAAAQDTADTAPAVRPRIGGAGAAMPSQSGAPDAGPAPAAERAAAPVAASAPVPAAPRTEGLPALAPAAMAPPGVPQLPAGMGGGGLETTAPALPVAVATETRAGPAGAPGPLAPATVGDATPRVQAAAAPAEDPPMPASLPRLAALPQIAPEEAGRAATGAAVRALAGHAAPVAAARAAAPEGSMLARHGAAFSNPQAKPLMAIVLIDDASGIEAEALAGFPYPLSFAVDPAAPEASARMARHRAAGFEVLALVDLPRHAAARDAEVLLTAGFAALPEAVGILEGTGTGIRGNRALSDQVADFLNGTGRGLVTQNSGLNAMQKRAARGGVAAAVVDRDIDGDGQGAQAILRALDQAAFRAGQEGAVILLGRLRPETVSALALWSLEERAGRVALAPVSAVLLQGAQPQ